MATATNIAWTDSTFNPWIGCTKVSPGCEHCYAEVLMDKRLQRVVWGAGNPRNRTSTSNWREPLKWDAARAAAIARGENPPPHRVFCSSLADVFDNEVPTQWRADLFGLIASTPHLTWQLLTKRIGNAERMMRESCGFYEPNPGCYSPRANVWIGATVVDQTEAHRDIPKLLAVPAARRFLSIEPLLGAIDLSPYLWGKHEAMDQICQNCPRDADCECGYHTREFMGLPALHWVIAGGESGHGARPAHPDWFRSLRDQCEGASVPFFFKQWGEWWEVASDARDESGNHVQLDPEADADYFAPGDCVIAADGRVFDAIDNLPLDVPCRHMTRLGVKAAGNTLDGRQHQEFPA